MGVFSGKKILKKGGHELDAEGELKDKCVILVYFSAHWCPPCRMFTPVLKDFYEALLKEGKSVAIVFVSSDQNEQDMLSYWDSQGDWYAAPYGSDLAKDLEGKCSVAGIPKLCVVNREGACLYGEARTDVQVGPPSKAYDKFKKFY